MSGAPIPPPLPPLPCMLLPHTCGSPKRFGIRENQDGVRAGSCVWRCTLTDTAEKHIAACTYRGQSHRVVTHKACHGAQSRSRCGVVVETWTRRKRVRVVTVSSNADVDRGQGTVLSCNRRIGLKVVSAYGYWSGLVSQRVVVAEMLALDVLRAP